MSKRILHVVSNVSHYEDPAHPTGLWLSELTHAWDVFAAQGDFCRLGAQHQRGIDAIAINGRGPAKNLRINVVDHGARALGAHGVQERREREALQARRGLVARSGVPGEVP